jgi:threonyl-tRNA synthetase
MIHRAPFGSLERFVAVLIEHCAGNFPLWLTPEPIILLPISEKYNEYSQKVLDLLKINDIRGHFDERNEKIGKKIRDAETKKVPYMLIIGEQEMFEESVSIRKHGGEDLGKMKVEDFINYFKQELTINQ